MIPAYSCAEPGRNPGTSTRGKYRNVESIAEADETGSLDRGLDVQAAGQHQRLVGDDADHVAVHAPKADDDVGGVVGLQLEELAVVHGLGDGDRKSVV